MAIFASPCLVIIYCRSNAECQKCFTPGTRHWKYSSKNQHVRYMERQKALWKQSAQNQTWCIVCFIKILCKNSSSTCKLKYRWVYWGSLKSKVINCVLFCPWSPIALSSVLARKWSPPARSYSGGVCISWLRRGHHQPYIPNL